MSEHEDIVITLVDNKNEAHIVPPKIEVRLREGKQVVLAERTTKTRNGHTVVVVRTARLDLKVQAIYRLSFREMVLRFHETRVHRLNMPTTKRDRRRDRRAAEKGAKIK